MKANDGCDMIKYKNGFGKASAYLYAAFTALMSSACLFFFIARANSFQDSAEYMFILKNGSNIAAAADEKLLLDDSIKVIKIRTIYGELEIPRGEILKYFKSSASAPAPEAPEKTQAEKIEKTAGTVKNEIEDENLKIKDTDNDNNNDNNDDDSDNDDYAAGETKENKENAAADSSKSSKADNLLNLDDDKLLDMLGESDIEPPKPVIATDTEKIEEIEEIRSKYQAKKEGNKKLIPDNLNSIESDIKSMAESSTEEDWLIAKFTREIQVETAGTVPVEIIEVGIKNSENGQKNNSSVSSNDGTKEAGIGKKTGGAAPETILSETEEVRIIGGGKLSEKIVKEFKKHKALSHKKISEKQHLNAEIQKHYSPIEDKKPAAETKEVKIEKK